MSVTTLSDPIPPCPVCGGPAQWFSRWHYTNGGPGERVYVWIECEGTPPCRTSDCYKDDDEKVLKSWVEICKREGDE